MELTPKAQTVELIRQSKKILLLAHSDADGDAVGSILALRLTLQKQEKEVDAALFGRMPQNCSFLPGYDQLKQEIAASNDLVITVDTRATGEELKLGHKKLTDKHQVVIVITPQKGSLVPEDISITRARPKYDLVILLDCSTWERLGPVHKELSDLFYETPTINIDHHADNSYFAKVNWVDLTSTSTAEMLVSLIESLGRAESLFDADIATALLTGLITDTNSFQNICTTPKSLTVAAQLVAAGARQQEIIEKIYNTKSLTTLKLWGKVLTNIKENKDLRFLWAIISAKEIESVGAKPGDTSGLIDELLKTVGEMEFVLLLSEREGNVHGSLRSVSRTFNVAELARLFGGGGHTAAAAFELPGKIEQLETDIIQKISDFMTSKVAPKSRPSS